MLIAAFLAPLTTCLANITSAPGPQPYLLFSVIDRHGGVVGTLSTSTDFQYFERSRDAQESVSMRANLLKKTSKGFRFSWSVVQRSRGIEVKRIREKQFVAWGMAKSMTLIPGYKVDVFYSRVPANERKDFWPNGTR